MEPILADIKTIRTTQGINRSQLAERTGLTPYHIYRIEKGFMPPLDTLQRVYAGLGFRVRLVVEPATENVA